MERASSRFDFNPAEPRERPCEHEGCAGDGVYRAPMSARQLREYRWFCLEHVREYNKAWNFCANFSEAEIEAMIRCDTTWERQTRPMTAWRAHEDRLRAAAEAFATGEAERMQADGARRKPARENTPEAQALRVFGLTPPVDYAAVRVRYIALVKEHHPDTNAGDKKAEERLKTINQAHETLKRAYLA
jgi:ketosteroid isomerase-like protein